MIDMTFDGRDLAEFLTVHWVEGREPFNQSILSQGRAEGVGRLRRGREIRERPLKAHVELNAKGYKDLRKKVDVVNNLLYTNGPVPISFSDEPNLTYYGEYSGDPDWNERNFSGYGVLPFTCLDPYKYSQETSAIIYEPNSTESSIVTLFADQKHEFETNESSINALPIFNAEFSASTDKFEIFHRQSRRRLAVTYDFEAGDTLTLNARNRRVQINGNTRMPALSMDSAWFDLVSGDNSFEVTDGVATVTLRYRTRWL